MNIEEELFNKHKKQLIRILNEAKKAEYYSHIIEMSGIVIDDNLSLNDFKKIPITDKNCYQQNRYKMIAKDMQDFDSEYLETLDLGKQRRPYLEKYGLLQKLTSGSTGQPLLVVRSINENRKDYINLTLYRKRYTNYNFKGKFVWVWPVSKKHKNLNDFKDDKLYKEKNEWGYKFYVCEHTDENMGALFQFIVENKIEWMTTPPSVAALLAKYVKDHDYKYDGLKYIECQSEKLYEWQTEIIKSVFNCDVLSVYSSNEVQFMGLCCSNGNIHIMDNSVFLECIENEFGQSEIYVTSLVYNDIPIIRYRLGDCGHWVDECDCEMNRMPSIHLEGFRSNDMIMLEDGKKVVPFIASDAVFFLSREYDLDIKEHKIKQISYNEFEYYFDESIVNKSNDRFEKFLASYLTECLNSVIHVEIKKLNDCKDNNFFGGKYKYFERLF